MEEPVDIGVANPTYEWGMAPENGSVGSSTGASTSPRRGVSTVMSGGSEQAYRRMSDESIGPKRRRDFTTMTRRQLALQYVIVILLAIVIALAVSLTVAYGARDPSPDRHYPEAEKLVQADCQDFNGGCEDRCEAAQNGVQCICDDPGFVLSPDNRTCADIDECRAQPCTQTATCVNTWGSYHCIQPVTSQNQGSTYTRWGRSICPRGISTERVYNGSMGGQYFSQTGGGSNYLCLPPTPEWANVSTAENRTSKRNFLSGAEFEKDGTDAFPFSSENLLVINSADPSCAVCRTKFRSSMIMIAARKSCPSGWTHEYHGYLMSEYHDHSRTEFICVDDGPEGVLHGGENLDGARLFLVQSQCGSLPCPPYVPGRDIVCVVCTR